ncbi:hypothetical protein BKA66DRAFT_416650 [Pyrenochaeta sp. MPI-SDFR-AT-0127]|nr:hypothetical protein BKA66DRAFT_416650 [Pyrenochaeta sp. MPI-SDFR-AT-0127]
MSLRRTHKKSRLGCLECKRRHVKCDENHPSCNNCLNTDRICAYQPRPRGTIRPSAASPTLSVSDTTSYTYPTPATSAVSPNRVPLDPQLLTPAPTTCSVASPAFAVGSAAQDGVLHPPLNMRHMELLTHFILEAGPSLIDYPLLDRGWFRLMMPDALSAPWLMHQLLALSAMHLSFSRPTEAKHYREEATALQMQALTLFNENMDGITAENCGATLMFASFLGLHSFAEAVADTEVDANGFLDRFVTYLNLHRGVKAVTQVSWELLLRSSFSSLLTSASETLDAAASQIHEQATAINEHLSRLLDQADMSTASETACRDAISHLQLIYKSDPYSREDSREDTPEGDQHKGDLIWAWPIMISGTFTELLMKRRPEALIILSHYAVLLHRRRHIWLVGRGGRMLIEGITKSLGSYWRNWLDWPNQVLAET